MARIVLDTLIGLQHGRTIAFKDLKEGGFVEYQEPRDRLTRIVPLGCGKNVAHNRYAAGTACISADVDKLVNHGVFFETETRSA